MEIRRVILLAVVLAAVAAATSAHMPVSTSDAAAQAAFDRGLFLYYAYNGDEAAKEFAPRGASGSSPRNGILGHGARRRPRPQHAGDPSSLRRRRGRDARGGDAGRARHTPRAAARRDHGYALSRHVCRLGSRRRGLPQRDARVRRLDERRERPAAGGRSAAREAAASRGKTARRPTRNRKPRSRSLPACFATIPQA